MEKFDLNLLVRQHLLQLKPYSSARDEYTGKEGVFLDANENSLGSATEVDYSRYPDPYQYLLKSKIADLKGVSSKQVFIGNGSDEPIDLIYRLFCEPSVDNVIIAPPTYGMYEVSANIHNIEIKKVNLTSEYQLDTKKLIEAVDSRTKVMWICSPNNPTGNLLSSSAIEQILQHFTGIVVIDEAYSDFSSEDSWVKKLNHYPNLIILQTMSKAWGMAGIRLGLAFASEAVMALLNKIKSPYNISTQTQAIALEALDHHHKIKSMVAMIVSNRKKLVDELRLLKIVLNVYPSDANFLLVKFDDAEPVFKYLIKNKIIVRNRNNVVLCEDCLRITVGTDVENHHLLKALKRYP